ncbi:MAG: cytochrome c [Immundisolibacteraceae bacterium]|nr:cytochrome c [Immundisolibacteraceae bacterium]
MKFRSILAATMLLTASATPLMAQGDPAEDALNYRLGVFRTMAWSFGPMVAMVKNKMPYDAALFSQHAERVAFLSHLPLEGFIADSRIGDTTAKPEVWTERAEFEIQMDTMISAAEKLFEVSKAGDLDAIRPQFGALGKSCKSCHDDFRTE